TMNRLPSSRCASVIQIVRPCAFTADTQPQLHLALLRLSAMLSQPFTGRAAFSDCSEPFAVRLCSVQAVRSLSGFVALIQLRRPRNPYAAAQPSPPISPLCGVLLQRLYAPSGTH